MPGQPPVPKPTIAQPGNSTRAMLETCGSAGRGTRSPTRFVRSGLRVSVDGRHPRQHSPGGTPAVPAGDDRRTPHNDPTVTFVNAGYPHDVDRAMLVR